MKTLLTLQKGDTLPQTNWVKVNQEAINQFADATGDHQWIHVDPERCAKESPFKKTIAHGFLTASMMPAAMEAVVAQDPAIKSVINYGIDRLRFLEPVTVDSDIAFEFTVKEKRQKPSGTLITLSVAAVIKASGKTALAGETLMLVVEQPAT